MTIDPGAGMVTWTPEAPGTFDERLTVLGGRAALDDVAGGDLAS